MTRIRFSPASGSLYRGCSGRSSAIGRLKAPGTVLPPSPPLTIISLASLKALPLSLSTAALPRTLPASWTTFFRLSATSPGR